MSSIKEFVIKYIDQDLNDYLLSKGFYQIKRGTYENMEGTQRIIVDDGIKCVSVERSFVYGEEKIELLISFIPEMPILEHLLKGIYFLR